jgi:hypothetical protein
MSVIYRKVLSERILALQRVESACISFDGWKGGAEQGKLVGINYHWVDFDWLYHSATLDLVEVQASQTGAHSVWSIQQP